MKRIVLFLSVLSVLSFTLLANDRPIDPKDLPTGAKNFLSQYFKGIKVARANVSHKTAILVELGHILWSKCPLVFPLMSYDYSVCL